MRGMEKIKVAIVLPYFGAGGADKMVAQLAAGLDTEKYHVRVFCVYGEPQKNHLEQMVEQNGVPICFIGKKLGFSLSAMVMLFQELDAFRPDVIHTHLYACVYAALWPVIRRKPFLHTFHTLPEIENSRLIRRLLTKILIGFNKMTPVAISKTNRHLVADYYELDMSSVPLVHNPVDIQRFAAGNKEDDGVFRFITVGRFSKEKNQQMMYRAFASFLSKGYDARLLMLGTGAEEENLKVLANDLGINDRIDYAGYVDNVEDYLRSADVFLLSSHYEAQPLCVLEAMAAGKPVISTDVGGVSDIVTDNGILVPANDVDAMSQAMEKLYLDKTLCRTMSERAMFNAAEYDITNTVAGYSELYRRYANRNKK